MLDVDGTKNGLIWRTHTCIVPPGLGPDPLAVFLFPSSFFHAHCLLPFSVLPFFFVLSFRFVVIRLFLVSPFLLFALPCSPWWRMLFFCLGATPPPWCLRARKCAYSPCCVLPCFLRCCVLAFYSFDFVLCLFPFSIYFRFGRRSFHPVFFRCCLLGFDFCCDPFTAVISDSYVC